MAYTTLLNATNNSNINELPQIVASSDNACTGKPHYTPAKALKKALKLLRRIFKHNKSSSTRLATTRTKATTTTATFKHQQLHEDDSNSFNATATPMPTAVAVTIALDDDATLSTEEYDNFANELLESSAANGVCNTINI